VWFSTLQINYLSDLLHSSDTGEKSDCGTLVPRINVENGIKLGFFIGINVLCTLKLKLF
jgi:hypothetical protein